MLRLFPHPVARCCILLGVDAQSLKPVKLITHVLIMERTQKFPTMVGVLASNVAFVARGFTLG